MLAGPNGSGKSTLKSYLPIELLGGFLYPDEIEQAIRAHGFLDFAAFGVTTTADEDLGFFNGSTFLASIGLGEAARQVSCANFSLIAVFSGRRCKFPLKSPLA